MKQLLNALNTNEINYTKLVLNRGEFLKNAGTIDTNLYYIVFGSLRIFRNDKNDEQTIRFGYKNNLIVALDSFITNKPSQLYIQALKQSTVLSISKKDFKTFINSTTQLQYSWNKQLEKLIYQQLEREIDLLTSSPLERYKRVLKRSPQLFQEIPHKYIASYLRMTPETLSRLKKS